MTGARSGPVGVGVVGAGNISEEYLSNLAAYPDVRVVGIADLDLDRAAAQAARHGLPFSGAPADLLGLPDVELVVNLTIPAVHAAVTLDAIAAGKHVWSEKPIALALDDALAVERAARTAGVLVGVAPDTILGEGVQTSARLLAEGAVGAPRSVLTLMQGPGPDAWHPRPQFLFEPGAGPLFDIGPYYVAALVSLLGPVAEVHALGTRTWNSRTIGSGPDAGTRFPVDVDTTTTVLTRFASGVVGASVYSFDSPIRRQLFEITGTAGTMTVPVSGFDGPTMLQQGDDRTSPPTVVPAAGAPRGRGVGVLDLARAVRAGRRPLAGVELGIHVLDVMNAVVESAAHGRAVATTTTVPDIVSMPEAFDPTEASIDAPDDVTATPSDRNAP
jgi:predicted dehydrogenase